MTNLVNISIGFICSTYDSRLSTNHTFRLKNLNKKSVIQTVKKNIEDFIKLLSLSQNLGCGIFRLGSQFVPFASHPNFKSSWWVEVKSLILEYKSEIKKFSIRITMHPGQYVILSTENKKLLNRSLSELKYHFWVLDTMEMDENSIVVIHGGGVYGNKSRAVENLVKNIKRNSWLKERLALENDEKSYSAKEIIEICHLVDLPFVFDYYHHQLLSSDIKIEDIIKTWRGRIPEFHLSSSPKNNKNKFAHGDYINKNDFIKFVLWLEQTTIKVKKLDILLEAKKKELAVKKLLASLNQNEKHLLV
ncbi:MAG: UV DNA damage repair endonuclease UvsE [Patescibacteria group bacterium]|nr:UV DNA damage repair endonuclease UvsE [Patescibacteria group bacterium]